MGGSSSKFTEKDINKEWMVVFRAMKFTTQEVLKLFEIYNNIDTNKNQRIEVSELLKFLDVQRTDFTERLFAALDRDGSGKLDFYEFVVSLWKFCTLGSNSISVFAFDLYDFDGDGVLTLEELEQLFHDLYWYGSHASEQEAAKRVLADLLKKSRDETVHVEDFKPFCKTHQALLMPVHAIQEKLRKNCMGVSFWERLSKRKIELRHGLTLPLSELMILHSDRKHFKELLDDRTSMGLSDLMRVVLSNTDAAHCQTEENSFMEKEKPATGFFGRFVKKSGKPSHKSVLPSDLLHESYNHHSVAAAEKGRRTSVSSLDSMGSVATQVIFEHQPHNGSFGMPSGSGSRITSPRVNNICSPGSSRPGSAGSKTAAPHPYNNLGLSPEKRKKSSAGFSFTEQFMPIIKSTTSSYDVTDATYVDSGKSLNTLGTQDTQPAADLGFVTVDSYSSHGSVHYHSLHHHSHSAHHSHHRRHSQGKIRHKIHPTVE